MEPPVIAVIDDNPVLRKLLEELLRPEGYRPLVWPSDTSATEMIQHGQPDVMIMDLTLAGSSSNWDSLRKLRRHPRSRASL